MNSRRGKGVNNKYVYIYIKKKKGEHGKNIYNQQNGFLPSRL